VTATPRFTAGAVSYDGQHADGYPAARELSTATANAWRDAAVRHLPAVPGSWLLDVGSGTGRFSPLLVEWFSSTVVGVEPASRMRAIARRTGSHELVEYVGGRAEELPFSSSSFDHAWLSNVVHHLVDRGRVAAELRRVLKPKGRVLVAGAFGGRLEAITMFRFFPTAKLVAEGFPSVEEVTVSFEAAGFQRRALERVTQGTCASLRELAGRTRLRADTTLQLISDDEFANGQQAIERAAEEEVDPQGVRDTTDLLVFERG
jgi:SAM-dependent methyltransferase